MLARISLNDHVESLAGLEGRELIARVSNEFNGRVAVLSSFGAESAVLLHMVSEVSKDIPVIFLDTLKLFPQTIDYRDHLVKQLGFRELRIVRPDASELATSDSEGDLHQYDTDSCCHVRKTLPMNRALADFDVVISGRKRFHGAARSDLQFVSVQDEKLKIEPLAGHTSLDLQSYMQLHCLPVNPLTSEGYRSIGCMPCTTKGGTDENPRAGRWQGTEKTECGIHFTANGKVIRTVSRHAVAV
jgi:phosphoadenosine phosphosulfate reductase